jgi:hypothetical protein
MKKGMLFIFYFICLISLRLDASHLTTSFPLTASYNIDLSWTEGYQATVTLNNDTSLDTTSWTAIFNLPDGQSISSLWDGVYTANGQTITVTNPAWNGGGVISGGGSTTFGMIVNNIDGGTPALNGLQASADGSPTPPPPVLSAPVLNPIAIGENSSNSYTVSWNGVANATSYTLQQDVTCSFSNPQTIVSGSILSFSFNDQTNGTYYYRVFAIDASEVSPFSNAQSIVIDVAVQLNQPVLQPIDNPDGSGQYLVSWNNVDNAQGYTLQQSLSSDFSNPQTIYQGQNVSFQVPGNSPGSYYYQVTAFAGSVTSEPSNIEEAVVTQAPPPPPPSLACLEGYWESWNSTDSVETIVNMYAQVIDIAFANFISTGTHTYQIAGIQCAQEALSQLVSLAHSLGKQVKISIGGATYGLEDQLQTTQDAVGMAQAIAVFVQQNSLDGVDFDIEDYPAPDLQVALIQNIRQLLGDDALISYTPKTPASTTYPYDQVIQAAYPYLTSISFMAYDYAPGYTYQQDVVDLEAMGVPPSKIIIGLMPGFDDLGVLTSLSDITTAAQYVLSQGLGGVMFWDLNRDHENLTGLGVDAATTAVRDVFSVLEVN